MKEPTWLEKEAVLLLHLTSLARFGGSEGLRDEAALEAALARPRNRYAYKGSVDLADLAAAYAFGFAKNHPFVDGNNRAAFMSFGVFLEINGVTLRAAPAEAVAAVVALADGSMSEREFSTWLRM